jgi:hypothetical protein
VQLLLFLCLSCSLCVTISSVGQPIRIESARAMSAPEPKNRDVKKPDNAELTSTPNLADEELVAKNGKEISLWRRIYIVLTWTPPNCRWDPKKPPQFSMSMSKFI